jgi:DNA-binding CsgD family transcriptional regulator
LCRWVAFRGAKAGPVDPALGTLQTNRLRHRPGEFVTDLEHSPEALREGRHQVYDLAGPKLTLSPLRGTMMLLDRRSERAVLDGLLGGARAGRSGVLVLLGDPGVGKTALLEYAIDSSADLRVGRAAGVESEMELAFAALHQLCAPVLDRLDRLPGPQRDALAVTFGLASGPVPDRFLVGLALLSLLSEVADERPLLCVIDDAQWLDRASAQALAFVARRLLAEPVVLLFGSRETDAELTGLPQLVVEGLGESDARELLRSVLPGRVDERVEDQIVAETRGNPLALLELPRGLSPAQLAGGFGWAGALPLSGRIEESFMRRFEALPDDARRFLLVAAGEPTGDRALLLRAAQQLGIREPVWEPAESVGLLHVGARVRFRHPLVRSAVYRTASPQQRREVHRALAKAIDADVDADRHAWHLAEATVRADEEVARGLERAAERAQARGGRAAAAAFLDRAAALTVEPSRRATRAFAAAQAKYEAGALDDALALLAGAEADTVDDLARAKAHRLRGQIVFALRRGSDAPPLLLQAARELEALDVRLARATYLEALAAASFAGRLARAGGVAEVAVAAREVCSPPPSTPSDLLLRGLAVRFTDGHAAAGPILKKALDAFRGEGARSPREARWLWLACWAASDMWDDETWRLLSTRLLEEARDAGALTAVAFALGTRSLVYAPSGDLGEVATMVDEARAVTEGTGIATIPFGALWLYALQGREAELLALIETTVSEARERGEGVALAITEHVSAILYNGLGRYEEALASVRHLGERSYDLGSPTRAVAELIEAAARLGQSDLARGALNRLVETAAAAGTDWALGVQARSRALLRDGETAEGLYRDAIDRLEHTRMRVDLARAHLLYGEWLRRQHRRVDARAQLRTAHEMLTAMGAEAFAGRAERELAATGEHARKRVVEARDDLTAQEVRIARLARDGLSNPEIGERLFISKHTVEYHLRKVFTKLGISSRHELDRVLPPDASLGGSSMTTAATPP